jgi:hypothetical protein
LLAPYFGATLNPTIQQIGAKPMEDTSTTGVDNSQVDTTQSSAPDQGTQPTESQTATQSDNLATSQATDEKPENSTSTESSATPTVFDNDLDEWAASTTRPTPTTDSERAMLQEIRDAQREFSRSRQAKDSVRSIDKSIADTKPDANQEETLDPLESKVAQNVSVLPRKPKQMVLQGLPKQRLLVRKNQTTSVGWNFGANNMATAR